MARAPIAVHTLQHVIKLTWTIFLSIGATGLLTTSTTCGLELLTCDQLRLSQETEQNRMERDSVLCPPTSRHASRLSPYPKPGVQTSPHTTLSWSQNGRKLFVSERYNDIKQTLFISSWACKTGRSVLHKIVMCWRFRSAVSSPLLHLHAIYFPAPAHINMDNMYTW